MTRWVLAGALSAVLSVVVGAQMDVSQMSGVPLPSGDLPGGTLTVRVVRGDMTNNVANQSVELHGAGPVQTVNTGADGRATFNEVPQNASLHVVSVLDGRRLESQNFSMPAQGGLRMMLVGAAASGGASEGSGAVAPATAPSAPATAGTVAFNGQSRFVVEVGEETVDFYALLDIANTTGAPLQTEKPLVIEAAPGAGDITVLEGSSPLGKAEGRQFVVTPPFPPGTTSIRFAYQLPSTSGRVSIRQVLPVGLAQTSLLVKKLPSMTLTSPQLANQRETVLEGQTYFVADGPGIPPGGTLELTLDGMPHHSAVPQWIALGAAFLIAVGGAWLSRGGVVSREAEREALESRREQLYRELVHLEERHDLGHEGPRRARRRQVVVDELKDVHARLEEFPPEPEPDRPVGAHTESPLRAHQA
ncbi:MAG: hypothetical protein AB7I50_06990 [Vicinamibacterales bacterium]